ncbi:hypothetical protein AVEN_53349-1 [Araneus ventricosus]|uniref:Uncharacterized protein n=1 Tax=Araneus ventricosus TaxID=182803 RepID=A0A4Y2ABC1_ARAVE|nr:hypothetical protein AVEN_53349-1 [Araneus ventricosus]
MRCSRRLHLCALKSARCQGISRQAQDVVKSSVREVWFLAVVRDGVKTRGNAWIANSASLAWSVNCGSWKREYRNLYTVGRSSVGNEWNVINIIGGNVRAVVGGSAGHAWSVITLGVIESGNCGLWRCGKCVETGLWRCGKYVETVVCGVLGNVWKLWFVAFWEMCGNSGSWRCGK